MTEDETEPTFIRSWLSSSGGEIAKVFSTGSSYIVRYVDVADFALTRDGRDIRVLREITTDPLTLSRVRENQIVPMAMALRGQLVVHASAVDINGRCAAFCGPSGRGKSTLATALALAGHAFLTDDGLRVESIDNVYWGWPRAALLGLRTESYAYFSSFGAFGMDAFEPSLHGKKTSVSAGDSIPHVASKLQVAGLYFLGNRDVVDANICRIAQRAVIQQLLSNTFVLDTTDRVALARHFGQISALAAAVPCFELNYPRSFAMLDSVVTTVREHVVTLAQSADTPSVRHR